MVKKNVERKNAGLKSTITAILMLHEDIVNEGYKFLLTSRLQQDPLEN